jgi:uncharacterized membrane protein
LIGIKGLSSREQTLHLGLAALTILLSGPSCIRLSPALRAQILRRCRKRRAALPRFPGNPEPDYIDFLYFAFVLGTTSRTSDVTINSNPMRRLALLHGVIASFFNTTLLALMVNIAAGLT